jgi:menaquinone-9 beta-reductase
VGSTVDAVVVGAGTAGANAAYQLARRGARVVLVERRPADRGGAQWHNGVLDRQFREADLDPPAPPERSSGGGGVTHLVGPDGTHGVTVHRSPVVRADMGLLGARLRDLARSAGVEVVDGVDRLAVEVVGDRVVAVDVTPGAGGPPRRIAAPLFVDASGRRGVLRRRSPVLRTWCPELRGDELCTASDHVLRIVDPDGAKRYLERHDALPGEGVTVVGLAGGFSTRAITVSGDLDTAAVLTGCLANGRYGTGPSMMAATRLAEPWLGESIEGGSGVIPLRRPYARITGPGVALVGDAACQVFPAHGSGIGFGLIAGTLLAETVAGVGDPGDPEVLWRYQADFQHAHGGLLAAHDGFRRLSTALGTSGVAAMIRAGLLSEDMSTGGLDQRWPTPRPADVPAMALRLARAPGVGARMVPMLARGQVLIGMGGRFPADLDEGALRRWDCRVARLLGPLPR